MCLAVRNGCQTALKELPCELPYLVVVNFGVGSHNVCCLLADGIFYVSLFHRTSVVGAI